MYAFGDDSSQTLNNLSASVLQYQAAAVTKCPQFAEQYKELVSNVAYEMNLASTGQSTGQDSTSDLVKELAQLNVYCSKGSSVASLKAPPSGSASVAALPLIVIVGIAAVLMMK